MQHISRHPLWIVATMLAAQLALLTLPVLADDPGDANARKRQESPSDGARRLPDISSEPSNEQIEAAVESELRSDPLVSHGDIDVAANDGAITLAGATPTLLARERAGRIAETVRGVRDVNNRIDVKPAVPADADELRQQVEHALQADPAAEAYEVNVSADDHGGIKLTGAVDSWAERKLAGRVAANVVGVTSISNDVSIEPGTVRSESEIRSDVENKLRWDRYVDAHLIDVAVAGGIVSLSGHVGSAAERTRAIDLAWTAGVRSVDASALAVDPWVDGRGKSWTAPTSAPNADVAAAIVRSFEASPRVANSDIDVTVDSGLVTLRGTVHDLQAKRAACSLAFATVGVRDVSDRLQVDVGASPPTDAAIRDEVGNALARNAVTEGSDIDVTVRGNGVRLSGDVDSALGRRTAEDVAAGIEGVESVDNDLRIDPEDHAFAFDPYVDEGSVYDLYRPAYVANPHGSRIGRRSDDAIAAGIRSQLQWSPFVDADQVAVDADMGIATLTGTVDSYPERAAAAENAIKGGATTVVNNLQVRG